MLNSKQAMVNQLSGSLCSLLVSVQAFVETIQTESVKYHWRKYAVRTLLFVPSFPPVGQNLWFTYDRVEEVDALMKNLNPLGIRESTLQTELKKRYPSIVKSLNTPRK